MPERIGQHIELNFEALEQLFAKLHNTCILLGYFQPQPSVGMEGLCGMLLSIFEQPDWPTPAGELNEALNCASQAFVLTYHSYLADAQGADEESARLLLHAQQKLALAEWNLTSIASHCGETLSAPTPPARPKGPIYPITSKRPTRRYGEVVGWDKDDNSA